MIASHASATTLTTTSRLVNRVVAALRAITYDDVTRVLLPAAIATITVVATTQLPPRLRKALRFAVAAWAVNATWTELSPTTMRIPDELWPVPLGFVGVFVTACNAVWAVHSSMSLKATPHRPQFSVSVGWQVRLIVLIAFFVMYNTVAMACSDALMDSGEKSWSQYLASTVNMVKHTAGTNSTPTPMRVVCQANEVVLAHLSLCMTSPRALQQLLQLVALQVAIFLLMPAALRSLRRSGRDPLEWLMESEEAIERDARTTTAGRARSLEDQRPITDRRSPSEEARNVATAARKALSVTLTRSGTSMAASAATAAMVDEPLPATAQNPQHEDIIATPPPRHTFSATTPMPRKQVGTSFQCTAVASTTKKPCKQRVTTEGGRCPLHALQAPPQQRAAIARDDEDSSGDGQVAAVARQRKAVNRPRRSGREEDDDSDDGEVVAVARKRDEPNAAAAKSAIARGRRSGQGV